LLNLREVGGVHLGAEVHEGEVGAHFVGGIVHPSERWMNPTLDKAFVRTDAREIFVTHDFGHVPRLTVQFKAVHVPVTVRISVLDGRGRGSLGPVKGPAVAQATVGVRAPTVHTTRIGGVADQRTGALVVLTDGHLHGHPACW